MRFTLYLGQYLIWHYSRAVASFFSLWGDFIWFTYNFFSIPLLLRTLFSPFQRISEQYKKGLDLGAMASTLLVNAIMRLVGAITRLFIVGMGFAALAVVLAAGLVLFLAWLAMPLIAATLALLGVQAFIV